MRETPSNTEKAKKSQSYFGYLSQWGTTPIHDFASEHDALKNLPEVTTSEHDTSKDPSEDTKRLSITGFEVASPKLRSFVKALIDSKENSSDSAKTNLLVAAAIRLFPEDTLFPELKKAEKVLENSEGFLEGAKEELTKLKVLGANLEQEKAQAEKALEEAKIACNAKESEYDSVRDTNSKERYFNGYNESLQEAKDDFYLAEKKQNEAQVRLNELGQRIDDLPGQIKSAEGEILKQQKKLPALKENLAKVKSEVEGLNKAMLLAFLDGDRAAFKKHFKAFEKDMCNKNPNSYALGFGSSDDLYNKMLEEAVTLTPENKKFLSGEDDKASFLPLLESVKKAAEAHLSAANDLSDASAKNHQKKLDAFISQAAHIKKDKLIKSLPRLKKEFVEARAKYNDKVLEDIRDDFGHYGEGRQSRMLYVAHAIAYVKPWCQSFFMVLDGSCQDIGKSLEDGLTTAQTNLETAQDDLKHIRQAAGFFSGFTYTSELKEVLQKKPKDDSNMKTAIDGNMKTAIDDNMKKAIETKETKPTLKTRVATWLGFKPGKDGLSVGKNTGTNSEASQSFLPGQLGQGGGESNREDESKRELVGGVKGGKEAGRPAPGKGFS